MWRRHLAPELRNRETSLSPTSRDRLWVPPSHLCSGTADFTWLKRLGREFNRSPPSAEVKNEWSYTSIFLYAFMAWGKFTLCLYTQIYALPIAVAALSKAWVCGRPHAGFVGSNPAGSYGCPSLVSSVCSHVEVSASGWSLIQRSPTQCGVSQCVRDASTMRTPCPIRGCSTMGGIWFVPFLTEDMVFFMRKTQR
jgi:hypothetical protein